MNEILIFKGIHACSAGAIQLDKYSIENSNKSLKIKIITSFKNKSELRCALSQRSPLSELINLLKQLSYENSSTHLNCYCK